MQPKLAMSRTLFASLLSLLVLSACPAGDDAPADGSTSDASTSGDSTTGGSSSSSDGSAADSTGAPDVSGEEFYLSVCAACHGNEGEGTAIGYEIQHPVRDYSTWVVRNGRDPGNPDTPGSTMVRYAPDTLGNDTLEEIWDYLDTPPQPTTGEALYVDYCRNCHGVDALGGITGVNILEPGALAELFDKVRNGENVGAYQNRGSAMPAFGPERISDEEVQLIADYLATL